MVNETEIRFPSAKKQMDLFLPTNIADGMRLRPRVGS